MAKSSTESKNRRPRPALWSLLAVVAAAGLIASIVLGRSQASIEQNHAVTVADSILPQLFEPAQLEAPVTGDAYTALAESVKGAVLSDGRILQVTVWNPDDGMVMFSTNPDLVGHSFPEQKHVLALAFDGDVQSTVTNDKVLQSDAPEEHFRTFTPLRPEPDGPPAAVVEIDQRVVPSGGERWWTVAKVAFGLALVVCLARLWVILGEPAEPVEVKEEKEEKRKPKAPAPAPEPAIHGPQRAVPGPDILRTAPAGDVSSLSKALRDLEKRQASGALQKSKPPAWAREVEREAREAITQAASVEKAEVVQPEDVAGLEEEARRAEELAREVEGKALEAERRAVWGEEAPSSPVAEAKELVEVEEEAGSLEEEAVAAELRAKEAEEEARLEEDAGTAERRAREIEEQARLAEEEASESEVRARTAEEEAGKARERASEADQRARAAEGKLRRAREENRRAEEKAREARGEIRRAEDEARAARDEIRLAQEEARRIEEELGQAEEPQKKARPKPSVAAKKAKRETAKRPARKRPT